MKKQISLKHIAEAFEIPETYVSAVPYGSGHINDTYAGSYSRNGKTVRYIHQRINNRIFKDVPQLMNNIQSVTAHIQQKVRQQGVDDIERRVLTLVPSRDQKPYCLDDEGHYWRTYVFIERAQTYDIIPDEQMASSAAAAFAEFQMQLADFPADSLHETIPDFHHTLKRFARLRKAVEEDVAGRAAGVREEIDFALSRETLAGSLLALLEQGKVPLRVTHNDTKLNNVMIDDATHEGICAIDLDTVMPGLALYDFGDMVRTATNAAAEDETDLSKVFMRMPMYEALVGGYMSRARAFLNEEEVAALPVSGAVITFETGIRFLTDYLEGDVYFKVHREGHNLDRCRTQFKLVRDMEEKMDRMRQVVDRGAASNGTCK